VADDDGDQSPDEVMSNPKRCLPDNAILNAAIVIFQFSVPAGETREDRGPFLIFDRDTEHGIWNHVGMIDTVLNDLRAYASAGLSVDGIDGDDGVAE
jgi:hypothetical protein